MSLIVIASQQQGDRYHLCMCVFFLLSFKGNGLQGIIAYNTAQSNISGLYCTGALLMENKGGTSCLFGGRYNLDRPWPYPRHLTLR